MKIDVIGTGNVGSHLVRALEGHADVISIPSRSLEGLRNDSDIYLISVTDDAIRDVAEKVAPIAARDAVLAHTSGTTPLSAISDLHQATGVFYPLQTFSKNVELRYDEIPFFIEGKDDATLEILKSAAELISKTVRQADSEKRKDIHIASVLSCNFVNHLWTLTSGYLKENDIDFEALLPLIRETTDKIGRVSPYDAQTGPAVRHDMKTIKSHEERIKGHAELLNIYKIMTESIMNHHKASQNH